MCRKYERKEKIKLKENFARDAESDDIREAKEEELKPRQYKGNFVQKTTRTTIGISREFCKREKDCDR